MTRMTIDDDYVGTKRAAELAGIDQTHVRLLCARGKVDGARKLGRDWLVPLAWAETFQRERRPKGGVDRVVR